MFGKTGCRWRSSLYTIELTTYFSLNCQTFFYTITDVRVSLVSCVLFRPSMICLMVDDALRIIYTKHVLLDFQVILFGHL